MPPYAPLEFLGPKIRGDNIELLVSNYDIDCIVFHLVLQYRLTQWRNNDKILFCLSQVHLKVGPSIVQTCQLGS